MPEPQFKDREEFLDAFFDHIYEGSEDLTDDDYDWFDSKVASFFSKLEGEKPPGRRRTRGQPQPPARRRSGSTSTGDRPRRSESGSGYGLAAIFGNKEAS